MRYCPNSNALVSLSLVLTQILITNSFTIINQFKSTSSFCKQKHYATIDSGIEETTTPKKERKLSKTEELNLQLSKLYHDIVSNGNISQVYDMEHIIFSYNTNNTEESLLDTISYNTLLSTWKNMAMRYEEGNVNGDIPKDILPKNHVYVAKDVALRSTRILSYMEDKDLVDVTSYNIVIDTWAKSKSNDGGAEVDKLLKRMLSSDDISPDVFTFNAILDTCSNMNDKTPDVHEKVEEYYSIMQSLQIKPNIRTYNIVMGAYSKAIANHLEVSRSTNVINTNEDTTMKNKQQFQSEQAKQQQQKRKHESNAVETKELQKMASKRVMDLFQEAKDDEELEVTAVTYTTAVDSLARCCLPHTCETLVNELEELFNNAKEKFDEESDDDEKYPNSVLALCPNIRTYTALINAWSWSKDRESPTKSTQTLEKVEQTYEESLQSKKFDTGFCNTIKPNVRTYTAVISCIAHSRLQDKAVLALNVLKRLVTKYTKTNDVAFRPNIFTYNAVIDTCSKVYASNCKNPKDDGAKMQSDALKIAFDVFKLIRKDKSVKANYVTYGTLLKATKNLLPPGEERNNIIKVLFARCCKEGHVDKSVLKQLRQTVSIDMYTELLGEDTFDKFGSVHLEKLPKAWSANIGN